MNKNKPFISIVVPVYNTEKYLKQCIDSILAQTFRGFELILVDDGSADESPKICDEYQLADSRVKVIHQENGGLIASRKSGVLGARGKYIGFIDSDDWIDKNMYEELCTKAVLDNADIVVCNMLFEYDRLTTKCTEKTKPGVYDEQRLIKEVYPTMLFNGHSGGTDILGSLCNKIFLTSIIRDAFINIDMGIHYGEDSACVYPCFLDAKRVTILNDSYLYHYRQNMESVTKNYTKNMKERVFVVCDYMKKAFEKRNAAYMYYQVEGYFIGGIMVVINNLCYENNPNTYAQKIQYLKNLANEEMLQQALNNVSTNEFRKIYRLYAKLLQKHSPKRLYAVALMWNKIKSTRAKIVNR